jgi:predicted DCC family thiol-disulfide oxidoreductase YuxK
MENNKDKIIFFDGVCNLCNGFINFIFSHDKKQIFKVASLQGSTAKSLLSESEIDTLSTVIFYDQGIKYYRSKAVIKILLLLGPPYNFMGIFLIIPDFLRDLVYKLIASNRYRMFGKKDSCRLPTPEERARFLP